MSTSLPEAIAHHNESAAALGEILKRFPDATFSDDYVQSASLKAEDCDRLFFIGKERSTVRAGTLVAGKAVLCAAWRSDLWLVVDRLKEKQPELYRELVLIVARGGR